MNKKNEIALKNTDNDSSSEQHLIDNVIAENMTKILDETVLQYDTIIQKAMDMHNYYADQELNAGGNIEVGLIADSDEPAREYLKIGLDATKSKSELFKIIIGTASKQVAAKEKKSEAKAKSTGQASVSVFMPQMSRREKNSMVKSTERNSNITINISEQDDSTNDFIDTEPIR